MIAELRKHVPANVKTVRAAFEDLGLGGSYGLFYAAAALHWTNPEGRWSRMAALLEPGGLFASFGGPVRLADPVAEEAVRAARAPFLESDEIPSPDGTPAGHDMQWPGTELQRSGWFADVQQSVIERRLAMSARAYIDHLSTISAYLELPVSEQAQVYSRIMQVLPEWVEISADITVHLARRLCEQRPSTGNFVIVNIAPRQSDVRLCQRSRTCHGQDADRRVWIFPRKRLHGCDVSAETPICRADSAERPVMHNAADSVAQSLAALSLSW